METEDNFTEELKKTYRKKAAEGPYVLPDINKYFTTDEPAVMFGILDKIYTEIKKDTEKRRRIGYDGTDEELRILCKRIIKETSPFVKAG